MRKLRNSFQGLRIPIKIMNALSKIWFLNNIFYSNDLFPQTTRKLDAKPLWSLRLNTEDGKTNLSGLKSFWLLEFLALISSDKKVGVQNQQTKNKDWRMELFRELHLPKVYERQQLRLFIVKIKKKKQSIFPAF